MFEHLQAFRQGLDRGHLGLGLAITFADPAVTEALAPSCDFVWLDLEHSPIGIETLSAHLMAADAARTAALVRVPSTDVGTMKRVLDTGAEGIIVPQINSAEEARTVVEACRYQPAGQRGFGPRRATGYGRRDIAEYVTQATREVFVAVQVETAAAYRDLDRILAVPGVDSIVIGPADLSASLGHLGQFDHPEVASAIETIIRRSRSAGRYVGMGLGIDPAQISKYAKLGVQWVMCGCDYHYLVAGIDRSFGQVRSAMQ